MQNKINAPNRNEYYPMLMPDESELLAAGGDENRMVTEKWQAYAKLPEEMKMVLGSDDLPRRLYQMEQRFGLKPESVGRISLMLRWLFFGKLSWNDMVIRMGGILLGDGVSYEKTQEISKYIHQMTFELASAKPSENEEEQLEMTPPIDPKNIRQLPILKALSEYPELHYQRITNEKITIKGEREPVAPTVRNWLRAYRDEVGVGQHTAVDRGKFLFQGANTKSLSAAEREKVLAVMKSLDDEEPLAIDTQKKTILFQPPGQTALPATPATSVPVSPRPVLRFETGSHTPIENPLQVAADGEISFSSNHTMPGERASDVGRNES